MDSIFYQPEDSAPIPEISQLDRISRLAALARKTPSRACYGWR